MRVPATCPCGSGRDYGECCGVLHAGKAATDAEALMRSRYSAYALGLGDYLARSWHASTLPRDFSLHLDAPPPLTWLGLDIKHCRDYGPGAAEVEFVARYRVGGGSATRLHERSRFIREDGHWFYLDGVHL